MSTQATFQNPADLAKLVRLYELRQNKARKAYQEHQPQLLEAQKKFDRCEKEHLVVIGEKAKLLMLEQAKEHASDLRVQQHIAVQRRWLKYDFDKTKYFVNDARFDLDVEKVEAEERRSRWMQLRMKSERYQEQLSAARKSASARKDTNEECETEEDVMTRLTPSAHTEVRWHG